MIRFPNCTNKIKDEQVIMLPCNYPQIKHGNNCKCGIKTRLHMQVKMHAIVFFFFKLHNVFQERKTNL